MIIDVDNLQQQRSGKRSEWMKSEVLVVQKQEEEFQDLNGQHKGKQQTPEVREAQPDREKGKINIDQFQDIGILHENIRELKKVDFTTYKPYTKNNHNKKQKPFGRLKSKLNFILESHKAEDTPSVSYYSKSRHGQSGNSSSSQSIQSNKRYVVYVDKKQKGQAKSKSNRMLQQPFLFYENVQKKEDIVQANRLQKANLKGTILFQDNEESQRQQVPIMLREQLKQQRQQSGVNRDMEVIFNVEAKEPSNFDQDISIIKVQQSKSQIDMEDRSYNAQMGKGTIDLDISLRSKNTNKDKRDKGDKGDRDKSLVRSFDKSRDSKLTAKKNAPKRRQSYDDTSNVLGRMGQEQIQRPQPQQNNKMDPTKGSFEQIKLNVADKLQSRYENVKDEFKVDGQRENKQLTNQHLLALTQQKEVIEEQSGSRKEVKKEVTKTRQKALAKHDYLKQIYTKTQPDEDLSHGNITKSKINFNLQSKRRLNPTSPDKNEQGKKFEVLLRKRQQAISKKMRDQLIVKAKQLFFKQSSQFSKKSSFQQLDIQSPTRGNRLNTTVSHVANSIQTIQPGVASKRVRNDRNATDRQYNFPPVGTLLTKNRQSKDYQTLYNQKKSSDSNRQLQRRGESTIKHRLKSDYTSSNSDKDISFLADSVRFQRQASVLGVESNKIAYSNLNKFHREQFGKNNQHTTAKEKHEKLRKLLEQI